MAGNNSSGKNKSGWPAGVTPYAEMGYFNADYELKDTDILCAFRLVPQEGVEPIEAAAAVGGTDGPENSLFSPLLDPWPPTYSGCLSASRLALEEACLAEHG